ncbi:MAG TPA: VOC family protein [Dehalococcoidia bacterium]|nr:VOC family protein [Dehalococcoidia bacterium]
MPLLLDHVIIAVADLQASAAALGAALGRRPSWRGRHPSYGTANVLFRLENAYVELLAPDAGASETAQSQAWTGSLGRFLKERGEGLFSVALQTADVSGEVSRARGRGLAVEEPLPGSGVDLDSGATREWVNARIPPEATRGTRCFFIEHRSPPSALPPAAPAADTAAAVSKVAAVVALSSEPEGARRMWREVFGLGEEAAPDWWRFSLGNAYLLLQAGECRTAAEGQPDCWEAAVLGVADLQKAAQRLAGAGLATARASLGGFEGVATSVCGAKLLFVEDK